MLVLEIRSDSHITKPTLFGDSDANFCSESLKPLKLPYFSTIFGWKNKNVKAIFFSMSASTSTPGLTFEMEGKEMTLV